MKNFIKHTINLILVCVLIYSGYKVFDKLYDYKKAESTYNEIQNLHKEEKNSSNSHTKLSDMNSDYRFWIKVENTNIDYPVVQGSDNYFYLYKDFNKEKLGSGSVFMDYRNDYKSDKNTILYGHNMKNKTMFNALENFKDKDFFNDNNKIIIEDKDFRYTYEVFSAYYVDANYNYLDTQFNSDEDYMSYIDDIKNKSLNSSSVEIGPDDKIITLSTCSYETDNTRTAVHGKLVLTEKLN